MLSIIVAMDSNQAIGIDNDLPWHISEDLKLFKRHTTGKLIVMGKNTYYSLNHPQGLPNRTNIVVSSSLTQLPPEEAKDVIFDEDIKYVLSNSKALRDEVFIIGGASIYKQALPYTDYLYISHVKNVVENADTFFPKVNWDEWDVIETEEYDDFIFKKYSRTKNL